MTVLRFGGVAAFAHTVKKTRVFEKRWLNQGTHQRNRRERPVCRSGGVTNTTPAGERYHPPPLGSPSGRAGSAQPRLRGPYSVIHCTNNGPQRENPPDLSFRANAVSRGIHPSGKFYLVVISYPTWWIPPLRLRCGRNDKPGGVFYFSALPTKPPAAILPPGVCMKSIT